MARAILGAAMLVGLFSHSTLTARAAEPSEDITREATAAGIDPTDLSGALSSEHDAGHDVDAHGYLCAVGEGVGCPVLIRSPEPPPVSVWDRVAQCESGGIWNTNTGNGYFGGLQEDISFWRNHGGIAYASRPDLASKNAQIAVAINGRDGLIGTAQGWIAWPVCSRRLGLR